MPRRIITELSAEQEAMLSIYRDKWRSIDISTESIDREKVAVVIKAAYAVSDYLEPEILFYSNPFKAIEKTLVVDNFKVHLGRNIYIKFLKRVVDHLRSGIEQQPDKQLSVRLRNQVQFPEFPHYPTDSHPQVPYFPCGVQKCIEHQLIADLDRSEFEFADISYLTSVLTIPARWAIWGCVFDFCISVLDLHHDKKNGMHFKS